MKQYHGPVKPKSRWIDVPDKGKPNCHRSLYVAIPEPTGTLGSTYERVDYTVKGSRKREKFQMPIFYRTGRFKPEQYIHSHSFIYSYTTWACRHSAKVTDIGSILTAKTVKVKGCKE
ncbi:unnamed protein product [Calicophoron daubneyi]|uniref:Uncharacterized protein n=1 Tax=Calicophoron daubneyi TaxID=300641 RepID=A0AAV2T8T2_CALDB